MIRRDIIKQFIYVNKERGIDKYFKPNNLVKTNSRYHKGIMLEAETFKHWQALQKEVLKAGFDLEIESGYRSYDYQQQLLINLIKEKGETYAYQAVAKPGHSEHQTGQALDYCVFKDNNFICEQDLDNLKASIYTNQLAPQFGFIVRYPKGKQSITGYIYEPWHLRYVGKTLALYLSENNLTLDEYMLK